MELKFRDLIEEANEPITHVLFARTGVNSAVNEFRNGVIEVVTIGNEGVVGHSVALGVSTSLEANCSCRCLDKPCA